MLPSDVDIVAIGIIISSVVFVNLGSSLEHAPIKKMTETAKHLLKFSIRADLNLIEPIIMYKLS